MNGLYDHQHHMNKRTFIQSSLAAGLAAPVLLKQAALAAGGVSENERISRLLPAVSGLPPREICFERVRLMTESYRRSAGEPPIVRKAKAFLAVANGLSISIRPDELIVGNIASKPRVAYFAPESYRWKNYQPGAEQVLESDLVYQHEIRFQIPEDIAEFWMKMPEGDTVGHFVPDYSKVLRLGFAGLAAEAKRRCEEHRRAGTLDAAKESFYLAAGIVCQAAERFARRHAETAQALAQAEADSARRAELEKIAAVCEHVTTQPARNFHEALQAF